MSRYMRNAILLVGLIELCSLQLRLEMEVDSGANPRRITCNDIL